MKVCAFCVLLALVICSSCVEVPRAQDARGEKQISRIKDVLCYVVKPISSTMRLPDSPPADGEISTTLRILACRGEYEPASFVLHALEDVRSLDLKASALKRKGRSIPSSAVDIKIVKSWYQSGNAWVSPKQDKSKRVLVPELLLNDETLVKVDHHYQENYLKLKFPEGDKYVWTSNPEFDRDWEKKPLPIEEYPLRDSPVLLPVNIAKGTYQQFWITVKAPERAAPGIYTGKIDLSTPEGYLGAITVKLRILPFALSRPKTNYDISQDFICSVYTHSIVYPDGKGNINNAAKTEEQYRAEQKNLLAHGVTSPVMLYPVLLARQLEIRKEVGLGAGPLFIDNAPAFRFRETVDSFDQSKRKRIQDTVKGMLKVARDFGISDVYIYGWDERRGAQLLAMKSVYKAIQEAGAKTFVAGFPGQFEVLGDALDITNMGPYLGRNKEEAERWHKIGSKITCYSLPFAGVENPEIYRRNYGLLLWKANYDGAMNFSYWWPTGYIWNDFDYPSARSHSFVYPTANGVIDTLAWEGYREALDDVRYATTLRLAIEKGKKSGDAEMRKASLSAGEWLDGVDIQKADLDTVRLKMIDHILDLSGKRKK